MLTTSVANNRSSLVTGDSEMSLRVLSSKVVSAAEVGEELAGCCLLTEHKCYGFCANGVKRMAFTLAINNGVRNHFPRQR
jgi:hypothetical protein